MGEGSCLIQKQHIRRPRKKSRGDSDGVEHIFNRRFENMAEPVPRAQKMFFDIPYHACPV
jgi:hypothetical protein